jgi:acyl-CoA synthetase (AMP-forming)/AMP-acid ligase II
VNLIEPLLEQAARHPQRPAIICAHGCISYDALLQRSAALAQRLAQAGLRRGDVAMPVLDVGIALYVTLLALFRLGAVAVFPEPGSGLRGLRQAADALTIDALIGDWQRRLLRLVLPELRQVRIAVAPHATRSDGAPDPVDLPADAQALITFTSGSTGRPKGIVRSHGFLLEQLRQINAVLQPREDDIALVSLPVFILGNLANGITSVLPDCDLRQPGEAIASVLLRQIERHRVNQLMLPPAMCKCLVDSGASLRHVTKVFTGGGPVFPDLLRRLSGLTPNARVSLIYGSSEAEPIAQLALDQIAGDDFQAMTDGAGLLAGAPVDGIRLRIENAEVWVSGPHVVKTYLNSLDDSGSKQTIDGRIWHRTGDAGRLDDRGRLWLLGRHQERVGKLYPFAVEAAAHCVAGVRNAAFLRFDSGAILVIEQDANSSVAFPRVRMSQLCANLRVVKLPRIPMDSRHHSKVDYSSLRVMLRRRGVESVL